MILRRLRRLRELSSGELSIWGLMTLEFAAIVAAVAIGFWVNEWREARARVKVVDSALQSLASELSYNQGQLVWAWGYYRTILEAIEARTTDSGDGPDPEVYGYQLPGWRGAMPPMLRSSSFATLLSTGTVSDLPYAQSEALARVYTFQKVIEQLDEAFLVRVANDPGFTRLTTIRHTFGIYVELIPSLLAIYEESAGPVLSDHGFAPANAGPDLRERIDERIESQR